MAKDEEVESKRTIGDSKIRKEKSIKPKDFPKFPILKINTNIKAKTFE